MNPSSSLALNLADYHKKSANLRLKILKNEEQRIQLEEKLSKLSNIDSRLKQRQEIEHIQSYFANLNLESQRAEQRNLQLLNDITLAEHNLNQLRIDAEHLIRLKYDYLQYLESNHPNWHKSASIETNTNIDYNTYDFNRLRQHQEDGSIRQNVSPVHEPYAVNSSILSKNYEDQFKFDSNYRNSSVINNEIKDHQQDDQSLSERTSSTFSRSKRTSSLRMELGRNGLYFLLEYIEKELIDTIDKKKFYNHDPPTITQERTIVDIANGQQKHAIKDLDPATTSMVILHQLQSTIRRTTINRCLLTEDLLSSNIKDLDEDIIAKKLPEQDRLLWIRLIDHFTQLLKFHIMSSETLANKFAPILLANNVLYLHDKAKSLLKHVLEKTLAKQQSSSEDEVMTDKKHSIQQIIKTNPTSPSSSSWLNKLTSRGKIDDDDTSSTTSSIKTPKKSIKSASSTATTPRANINHDDSDFDFYS